jgi:serralysin
MSNVYKLPAIIFISIASIVLFSSSKPLFNYSSPSAPENDSLLYFSCSAEDIPKPIMSDITASFTFGKSTQKFYSPRFPVIMDQLDVYNVLNNNGALDVSLLYSHKQWDHTEGVIERASVWKKKVITVRCIDPSDYTDEFSFALKVLSEYWGKAGITFVPMNTGMADVRVKFAYYSNRNESEIGKFSYSSSKDSLRPSMYISIPTGRPYNPADLKRKILHEFGHALGLLHEHFHPTNKILWDTVAVNKYYTGRSPQWLLTNLYKRYEPTSLAYTTRVDTFSIMTYDISPLLTNNSFRSPLNYVPSDSDIALVKRLYK